MIPIEIPPTTPLSYVSFNRALNLRLPDEETGDWHFYSAFFCEPDEMPTEKASLAGPGGLVDTTHSLGSVGVRNMAQVLERLKILPDGGPVYVANHYRAIADLAMLELNEGRIPMVATPSTINQWLGTEEQVNTLVSEYLSPLGKQLDGKGRKAFEKWLPTIRYI